MLLCRAAWKPVTARAMPRTRSNRLSGTTPRGESAFHIDTLDLYSARQRGMFTKQAAEELGVKEDVIRHDLGWVVHFRSRDLGHILYG